MSRFFPPLLIAATLVLCAGDVAKAQEPSQAQRDAIRASCRSDFMANCRGVQPGGKDALDCLKRNAAKLSASCATAVNAIATGTSAPAAAPNNAASSGVPQTTAAPVAAQSQQDEMKIVRQACTLDDLMTHCSWVAPNSPELLLCLKGNASSLSPACQNAVLALAAEPPPAAAPAPAAEATPAPASPTAAPVPQSAPVRTPKPSAPAPAAAAPSQKPTSQQLGAIRAACRSDFMAHCAGIQPGGAAALQCLQGNSAKLSASCQTALAAVGQGAPQGASEGASQSAAKGSATTAAATPAVAPLGSMPAMRPREAIAILRVCGTDRQALCPNIPVGGGRVISCLAANAAALSPGCYTALSAAARR